MSPSKNTTRVLLVDDNPLILDMMRKGLEPHADIATCQDGTDALLQCIGSPPDLVICDYRMPGLDGRQFVEKLKARPETRAVRVILVATKSDISEKLRPMTDQVEEFFEKPFYVKDLASKTKKVLERIYWEKKQKEAPQEGVIRGRLAEMNMIDLLQSLELGQKTCSLTVTRDGENCRMFFAEGQINHAELGSVVGDDAVFQVVGWPDGSFEINFNSRSDKQTTTRSTQGLLMEALRMLDEQNRGSSE
jgi:CheY-like chemotaxis protein